MAHNLNNIIVDRVLRGIFTDKNDNIIFSLNQIQDLSLNQTSESQEVQDAFGVSIAELMRSKAIEASANNAIYDFGLLAAQYGTTKTEKGTKLTVPTMESFVVPADSKVWTLKNAPIEAPVTIYELNGDSTLGAKHESATAAAAPADGENAKFAYDEGKITLYDTIPVGTEMFVMYEYETENAIEVVNKANEFAKLGKMTFEILAYDVCDPQTKLYGYLVIPKFQLSNDFDWSIGGDSQQHAFSGKALVDYCSRDKKMCRIVIVDDEE